MSTIPITRDLDPDSEGPLEVGIGLCLSGGGYRAMLFHVGTLWRLNEAALLQKLRRISSVSGGSITAGVLGLRWPKTPLPPGRPWAEFEQQIVGPLRALASETIDAHSIITGLLMPGKSVGDMVAEAYRTHLFGKATLQDLPDQPTFVFNATNVQSGVLWRFRKDYMRDYRVGEVKSPRVELAVAVAASSAFPPVLSPVMLKLDPASFTPGTGADLQRPPFTTDVCLADGGVYDNMGMETVWKRYQTVLISDAGARMGAEEAPHHDWGRHAYRVLGIIDNQVRSLRKRQVIAAYKAGERSGAYWGIHTHIADYLLGDALPAPDARTNELAEIPTRLAEMDDALQKRLINWGYAVTDAALRKHVDPTLAPPLGFPYPGGV